MAYIHLGTIRAQLTRLFNLQGDGPAPYLPLGENVNLTFDINQLLAADPGSSEMGSAERIVEGNFQFWDHPLVGMPVNINPVLPTQAIMYTVGPFGTPLTFPSSTIQATQAVGWRQVLQRGLWFIRSSFKIEINRVDAKVLTPIRGRLVGEGQNGVVTYDQERYLSPDSTNAFVVSAQQDAAQVFGTYSAIFPVAEEVETVFGWYALEAFVSSGTPTLFTASALHLSSGLPLFPIPP